MKITTLLLILIVFTCVSSAAVGQNKPVPENCISPEGLFNPPYLGPQVVWAGSRPCVGHGNAADYLKVERGTGKDKHGVPIQDTVVSQNGDAWRSSIAVFYYERGKEVAMNDTYLGLLQNVESDFRSARLLLRRSAGGPQEQGQLYIYRDGKAKVFVLVRVTCDAAVMQQVRVQCDQCEEDAIGGDRLDDIVTVQSASSRKCF